MAINSVIKRDGEIVEFDINKIKLAVLSAITACKVNDNDFFETVMDEIDDEINEDLTEASNTFSLSVESIQDIVVSVLKNSEHPEVGIHYSDYRRKKELQRSSLTNIEQSVQKLVDRDSEVVNENANKDADVFNTQRDLTAGLVAKTIGIKYLLPKRVANAHVKGQIHWHDLDYSPYMPMTNCSVIDIENVLQSTVKIGNATLSEPKSIGVAVAKITQTIGSIASSQYGLI